MKHKLIILCMAMLPGLNSFSQVKSIGDLFACGTENAEILFEEYLAPWTNAVGASMSGGWYNTAKPHSTLGFDLTFSLTGAYVPAADKSFDLSTLGLQNVSYPNGTQAATVSGSKDGGQDIVYTPDQNFPDQTVQITTPNGSGIGVLGTPMLKLGIGIIKETELNFRYVPKFSVGNFAEFGLWGIGVKHSIKQWIPVISKVPVLQLSVQGGYTQLNSSVDITVTPESYGLSGSGDYDNQQIFFGEKSFTANLLVGADLPIVDFYGGIGFATSKANLILKGYYPIPVVEGTQITTEQSEKDPINAEITNSDGNKTKPRFNVGMRLKFGIFTLSGDYTYANYSMATAAVGISFR